MSDLLKFIKVYENVVSNRACDLILKEYGNSDDWVKAEVSGGLLEDKRNCSTIGISFDYIMSKNFAVRKLIDEEIFNSSARVIKKYSGAFPKCKIDSDSGYNLLRYNVGQFYVEHVDSFKERPRAVSCSFALNDGYEGGEFSFFQGTYTVKVPKGAAIVFPSNFMYPHQILPVTSGSRYSIVTWFI